MYPRKESVGEPRSFFVSARIFLSDSLAKNLLIAFAVQLSSVRLRSQSCRTSRDGKFWRRAYEFPTFRYVHNDRAGCTGWSRNENRFGRRLHFHLNHFVMNMNARDRERGPRLWQVRIDRTTVSGRSQSTQTVDHDLRDHDAFEEFSIEAQPAGHIAALHRAA